MNETTKYGLFFLGGVVLGALGAVAVTRGKLDVKPLATDLLSAGIDLNYAKAVIGKPGRSLYGVYHWQQAYRFWSECNLPVVVGIQGACMGTAIELITACDIRIAADNAKFSLREVDVGISTDLGGTTRLTKLIGPGMRIIAPLL